MGSGWVHPGVVPAAHLPLIDKSLYIGNADAYEHSGIEWGDSLCAAFCKPGETRHIFLDRESHIQAKETAKQFIIEGADYIHNHIQKSQEPLLVHCHMGINRSGAMLAAYAILYLNWNANQAREYIRNQNLIQRALPYAVTNKTFYKIIEELVPGSKSEMHAISHVSYNERNLEFPYTLIRSDYAAAQASAVMYKLI
tara:strand:- start:1435 stop:2025 length:591 start_codon:yes stop_codon:yes gene_type:complete